MTSDQFAERLRDELVPFIDFDSAPIFLVVAKAGERERAVVSELIRTTMNLRRELAFALREDNTETCEELVVALNAWKLAYKEARPMIAPVPEAGS